MNLQFLLDSCPPCISPLPVGMLRVIYGDNAMSSDDTNAISFEISMPLSNAAPSIRLVIVLQVLLLNFLSVRTYRRY